MSEHKFNSEDSKASRNFFMTWNNYPLDYLEQVKKTSPKYFVLGEEIGEQGTKHIQGFISYKHTRLATAMCKHFKAYVRNCISSLDAIAYCKKELKYNEYGEFSDPIAKGQKAKCKFEETMELIKAGKIEDISPMMRIRYNKSIREIQREMIPEGLPLKQLDNIWIVGNAGVGKSYRIHKELPNHYYKQHNLWWDGYKGEEDVYWEDFDIDEAKYGKNLKCWADIYPFSCEVKGGSLNKIRPKRFIVTSNYTIEQIWPNDGDKYPLLRRFKVYYANYSSEVGYTITPTLVLNAEFKDSDETH